MTEKVIALAITFASSIFAAWMLVGFDNRFEYGVIVCLMFIVGNTGVTRLKDQS